MNNRRGGRSSTMAVLLLLAFLVLGIKAALNVTPPVCGQALDITFDALTGDGTIQVEYKDSMGTLTSDQIDIPDLSSGTIPSTIFRSDAISAKFTLYDSTGEVDTLELTVASPCVYQYYCKDASPTNTFSECTAAPTATQVVAVLDPSSPAFDKHWTFTQKLEDIPCSQAGGSITIEPSESKCYYGLTGSPFAEETVGPTRCKNAPTTVTLPYGACTSACSDYQSGTCEVPLNSSANPLALAADKCAEACGTVDLVVTPTTGLKCGDQYTITIQLATGVTFQQFIAVETDFQLQIEGDSVKLETTFAPTSAVTTLAHTYPSQLVSGNNIVISTVGLATTITDTITLDGAQTCTAKNVIVDTATSLKIADYALPTDQQIAQMINGTPLDGWVVNSTPPFACSADIEVTVQGAIVCGWLKQDNTIGSDPSVTCTGSSPLTVTATLSDCTRTCSSCGASPTCTALVGMDTSTAIAMSSSSCGDCTCTVTPTTTPVCGADVTLTYASLPSATDMGGHAIIMVKDSTGTWVPNTNSPEIIVDLHTDGSVTFKSWQYTEDTVRFAIFDDSSLKVYETADVTITDFCVYKNYCQNASDSLYTECEPISIPRLSSLAATATAVGEHWTLDASLSTVTCDMANPTTITATPSTPKCYVGPATGVLAEAPTPLPGLCPLPLDPQSFVQDSCTPTCSAFKQGTCTFSFSSNPSTFPLDSTTCQETCGQYSVTINPSTPLKCGDTYVVTVAPSGPLTSQQLGGANLKLNIKNADDTVFFESQTTALTSGANSFTLTYPGESFGPLISYFVVSVGGDATFVPIEVNVEPTSQCAVQDFLVTTGNIYFADYVIPTDVDIAAFYSSSTPINGWVLDPLSTSGLSCQGTPPAVVATLDSSYTITCGWKTKSDEIFQDKPCTAASTTEYSTTLSTCTQECTSCTSPSTCTATIGSDSTPIPVVDNCPACSCSFVTGPAEPVCGENVEFGIQYHTTETAAVPGYLSIRDGQDVYGRFEIADLRSSTQYSLNWKYSVNIVDVMQIADNENDPDTRIVSHTFTPTTPCTYRTRCQVSSSIVDCPSFPSDQELVTAWSYTVEDWDTTKDVDTLNTIWDADVTPDSFTCSATAPTSVTFSNAALICTYLAGSVDTIYAFDDLKTGSQPPNPCNPLPEESEQAVSFGSCQTTCTQCGTGTCFSIIDNDQTAKLVHEPSVCPCNCDVKLPAPQSPVCGQSYTITLDIPAGVSPAGFVVISGADEIADNTAVTSTTVTIPSWSLPGSSFTIAYVNQLDETGQIVYSTKTITIDAADQCKIQWFVSEQDPTAVAVLEFSDADMATIPAGWTVKYPTALGATCGDELTATADVSAWSCGYYTQFNPIFVSSDSLSCTDPTPRNNIIVTDCSATCSACDTASACTAKVGTQSFTYTEYVQCNPQCACAPKNISFDTGVEDIACADELQINWTISPLAAAEIGTLEIYAVETSSDDLTSLTPVHTQTGITLASKTTTLTYLFSGAGVDATGFVFKFQGYDDKAFLPFLTNGKCNFEWFCSTTAFVIGTIDGGVPTETASCTAPTATQVVEDSVDSAWTTTGVFEDLECDSTLTKITYEPPAHTACLITGSRSPGLKIDVSFASNVSSTCAAQTPETEIDFNLVCAAASCPASTCGGGACTATLGGVTIPGFSKCGVSAADCSCSATLTFDLSSVNCQDTLTVSWVITTQTPSPTGTLEFYSLTDTDELDELIDDIQILDLDAFTSTSIEWAFPQFATGTKVRAKFADADNITVSIFPTVTIATQCVAELFCVDTTSGDVISCDDIKIKSAECTVCNNSLPVSEANTICAVGTVQKATEITPNFCATVSPPTIACPCDVTCKTFPCNALDQSWTLGDECGQPDTRLQTDIQFKTISGSFLPCTGTSCNDIPLNRVTPDNISPCNDALSTQCSATATDQVGTCNPDFTDCSVMSDDEETCGSESSRIVYCTVTFMPNGSTPQSVNLTVDQTGDQQNLWKLAVSDLLKARFSLTTTTFVPFQTISDQIATKCFTDIASPTKYPSTNTCDCTEEFWCWKDVTSNSQTVPTITDLSTIQRCTNTKAQFDCPRVCRNAGITAYPVDRPLFCRQTDGTWQSISTAGATCGDEPQEFDEYSTFDCLPDITCTAGAYCQAPLTHEDITLTELKSLVGAVGDSDVAVCTEEDGEENNFSTSCYVGSDQGAKFEPTTCTFDYTGGANPIPNLSIRHGGCGLVYTASSDAPYVAGQAVQSGNLCAAFDPPDYTMLDCQDFSGCATSIEESTAVDSNGDITSTATVDIGTKTDIKIKFKFLGPLNKVPGTPHTVALQWAYSISPTTLSTPGSVWFDIKTVDITSVETELVWTIDEFPDFDFAVYGTTVDTLTIHTRLFITSLDSAFKVTNFGVTADEYHSPVTISLNRNLSCSHNSFTGVNEKCVDTAGVATRACVQPASTVGGNTSCARPASCDATTPTCLNSGFYGFGASGTTCATSCTCTGGFGSSDQCQSCIACPVGIGIQKTTGGCGCSSCRPGFFNGPNNEFCTDCRVSTKLTLTNPAAPIISYLSTSSPTNDQKSEFAQFERAFIKVVSSTLNFPAAQISIDQAGTTYSNNNVIISVQFQGDCTKLAKVPAESSVTLPVDSADLSPVVNDFDTKINTALLTSKPTLGYAIGRPSAVSAASDFTIPPLFVPTVDPEQPDDDGGSSSTVIIVVVVVVVIVVIVAAIVIFVVFFRKRGESGSTSSEPKPAKAEKAPKSPKSPKASKKENFANDTAHLELV